MLGRVGSQASATKLGLLPVVLRSVLCRNQNDDGKEVISAKEEGEEGLGSVGRGGKRRQEGTRNPKRYHAEERFCKIGAEERTHLRATMARHFKALQFRGGLGFCLPGW